MDAAEANKYGKIAYESNTKHLICYGTWDNLDVGTKKYWAGIAIAVLNAHKEWLQQNQSQ